jgi:hypothetical protein
LNQFLILFLYFSSQYFAKFKKIELNIGEDGQLPEFNEKLLNFDPEPVNTFIFDQTVLAVKDAVLELNSRVGSGSAVVVAVGDANSSPHSFTSSGTSTGTILEKTKTKLN